MESDTEQPTYHWADIVVIVIYLLSTLGVGVWTIIQGKGNIRNVFLANRSITWWPVGLSLFASNIGSNNFVGISGTASMSGMAVIMFEWNAIWLLILLGWVFLPVYISSGIYTMPEYLEERFGGNRVRIYLSCMQIITYVFTQISTDLYSVGIFLKVILGWNMLTSLTVILVLVMIFTGLGGLRTVIFTDALAVFVMCLGGILLSAIGFHKVGGYKGLYEKYNVAIPEETLQAYPNRTCGYPRDDAFHIFRDAATADYPWLGTLLRTTIGIIWYWCCNQVIVQRALAAKDIGHARGGTILAGYMKLTPMFIMVWPGMISRVLFVDEVACSSTESCERICGNPAGCSNIALPRIVSHLLPPGVRGLFIAAVIAAIISSLTSVFNSCGTLFTMDIWTKIRKKASEREMLIVSRVAILILTGISILWIPMMSTAEGGQLYKYTTAAIGYCGAPTCALFVLALFWERCNEQGAFWGVVIASLYGLARFILDAIYSQPYCGEEDKRISFIKNFHSYYFTVTQILLAFFAAVIISLLTKPGPKWRSAGTTWWRRYEKPARDVRIEGKCLEDGFTPTSDEDFKGKHLETNFTITSDEDGDVKEGEELQCLKPDNTDVKVVEDEMADISLWQRFLEAIIGSSKKCKSSAGSSPTEPYSKRLASLQIPGWKRDLLNINAAVLLTILAFLLGYFK